MKYIAISLIIILVLLKTVDASSQEYYTSVKELSSMKVSGTSNLHDWEMVLEDFQCTLVLEGGNPSVKIHSVNFTGHSKSLESNSSIMNNKTYDAILADKYPEIRFSSSSLKTIPVQIKSFTGTVSGKLILAGRTNPVSVSITGEIITGNEIMISGTRDILMSDYKIEAPTALMGTLKTGDEVTISFSLVLRKTN
jgi:polyisoprenoid-binding protein YceI